MILVKSAGYSLEDIRGASWEYRTAEEPSGLMAAASSLTPRSVRVGAATLLGLGGLLAYETGLLSAVAVSVALAVLLHYASEVDAEPVETVHEVEKPGMSVEEVMGRLHQHDEHEQMKNEEAEAEARKARRKGGAP